MGSRFLLIVFGHRVVRRGSVCLLTQPDYPRVSCSHSVVKLNDQIPPEGSNRAVKAFIPLKLRQFYMSGRNCPKGSIVFYRVPDPRGSFLGGGGSSRKAKS